VRWGKNVIEHVLANAVRSGVQAENNNVSALWRL
jgi:hypothetical protein